MLHATSSKATLPISKFWLHICLEQLCIHDKVCLVEKHKQIPTICCVESVLVPIILMLLVILLNSKHMFVLSYIQNLAYKSREFNKKVYYLNDLLETWDYLENNISYEV